MIDLYQLVKDKKDLEKYSIALQVIIIKTTTKINHTIIWEDNPNLNPIDNLNKWEEIEGK